MTWLEIILLVFISLISLFFLFVLYVAYRMAKPPREVGEWNPKEFGLKYEDFEIENSEGIKIRGWYVDKKSSKTVFLLHGYTVSRWTFYIRSMVEFLSGKDYNLVIFDFRAHGKSGGKYTTVGDREIEDLKAVIKKFATSKNCVVGYSMGGIVSIRSLLIPEVNCAVADSPPIFMDKTGRRGLKYFANLPEWIYSFARPFFSIFTKSKGIDVLSYADEVEKPLLLIVGSEDPLVRVEEIQEFYERNRKINPKVEIWLTNGAHVRSVKVEPEKYRRRVLEFIEKCLK